MSLSLSQSLYWHEVLSYSPSISWHVKCKASKTKKFLHHRTWLDISIVLLANLSRNLPGCTLLLLPTHFKGQWQALLVCLILWHCLQS